MKRRKYHCTFWLIVFFWFYVHHSIRLICKNHNKSQLFTVGFWKKEETHWFAFSRKYIASWNCAIAYAIKISCNAHTMMHTSCWGNKILIILLAFISDDSYVSSSANRLSPEQNPEIWEERYCYVICRLHFYSVLYLSSAM